MPALDVGIQLFLMLVEVGERGVYLGQRQVGILRVNLVRISTLGDPIERDLDHLGGRIFDVGHSPVVQVDERRNGCGHRCSPDCLDQLILIIP